MNLGLKTRNEVLTYALILEGTTSIFLAGLLGIKDPINSRTLGNKGSSLSFNTKIDMLIDIGALDVDKRNKYQAFMEIRNQFMHNMEASTYEKCFYYLPEKKDTWIFGKYPQPFIFPIEERLKRAVEELSKELIGLTTHLMQQLKNKFKAQAKAEVSQEWVQDIVKTLFEIQKNLDTAINNEITKGVDIDPRKLKNLGSKIVQLIYKKLKSR